MRTGPLKDRQDLIARRGVRGKRVHFGEQSDALSGGGVGAKKLKDCVAGLVYFQGGVAAQ